MEDLRINPLQVKRVHFIGIGGIGLSAIARMFFLQGARVTGSDLAGSPVTESLRDLGITVSLGHQAENIPHGTELVIYTIALDKNDLEFRAAKARGIPMLSYPESLRWLSKDKYTIAVAGTHGKTTTTAMIAQVLIEAGYDPTVIVGSLLRRGREHASNFIAGKSNYFIVEACEYRRSFLNIFPQVLVITNIEADHLDYYHDIDEVVLAFRELAMRVPKNGFIICDKEDSNILNALKGVPASIIDYNEFEYKGVLQVFGAHNRSNANAAKSVGRVLEIPDSALDTSLGSFQGVWRRFEYRGKTHAGALVYDDYAHHPTEIRATINGAREAHPEKKIVVVFQPHLYSRTKSLFTAFAEALSLADQVLLLPIYGAREQIDRTVKSEDLLPFITSPSTYTESFEEATSLLSGNKGECVIITLGAGNVYEVADALVV